ncbi:MAG: glycosyltransferase family 2 protein [Selenomonadaceae bacterium]|nr:glycosyltransferase family 2 protein [Selenomonadaceae bacterium]
MAKKSDKKSGAPAISVVIALYNTEKYIAQCLESLLAQTMQDFEVIVADDCSTDNSAKIVAELAPKFEGRLKLIRLKKNSGFPGLPRNTAMGSARGKYIAFLDSDDFYHPSALEYFYKVAEATNAEVVHAERYYAFDEENKPLGVTSFQQGPYVEQITLEPENIGERIVRFINYRTLWWGINKLFRRDFLVKNNIQFPLITAWEDLVLNFHALLRAKLYVRVPEVVYCYRIRKGSLSHKGRDAFEMTSNLIGSMKAMDKVMEKTEFVMKNPAVRYAFVDWYVQGRLQTIRDAAYNYDKLQPFQIYELYRRNFFAVNPADQVALYSYFFTITTYNQNLLEAKNAEIANLKKQIENLQAKLSAPAENS